MGSSKGKAGKLVAIALLSGLGLSLAGSGVIAGEVSVPPLPSEVRLHPSKMTVPPAATPPLGWRYAKLSQAQTRVLRRGFKLPMDALAVAKSPDDLVRAVVLAPLPDPNRPILAVSGGPTDSSDPFAGTMSASLRKDPMGALGQLLGADESAEMSTDALSTGGGFAADPFAGDDDSAAETSEVDEAGDDATDEDPFAADGEDDPFADF